MAACSALAEHISSITGMPTRVVGWYHSHPHITVLPSHVDVNTQVTRRWHSQQTCGFALQCHCLYCVDSQPLQDKTLSMLLSDSERCSTIA